MTKSIFRKAETAGLVAGAALLALLTGCTTAESNHRQRQQARGGVHVQASIAIQDDYDYYPRFQVYHNRSRNEYVYRDGFSWVRRPQPRGVTVAVLFASPSVRLDFHDAPSRHHRNTVRTYPRNWAPRNQHDDANDLRDNDRHDDDNRDRRDRDDRDGRDHDRRN